MARMEMSKLTLIRRQIEYLPADSVGRIPRHMQGIYVLYRHHTVTNKYNVHYVGIANGRAGNDVRTVLLRQHPLQWTHCSVYELWDRIRHEDHREVEALFRHIYRDDANMNPHNSKSLRTETFDNTFLPKELFEYFIRHMAAI